MRDAVRFQMLQTRAQLQQEKTHTPFVDLRLCAVERLPVSDEIGYGLVRDVSCDDHHALLLCRGRCCGGCVLLGGEHALRDACDEVTAVLLEVEVWRDALLDRQAVQMSLLTVRRLALADLHRICVACVGGTGGGVIHSVSRQAAGFVAGQFEERPVALVEPQCVPVSTCEVLFTLEC